MDFSTLFRLEENLNLDKKTLVFLRWIAILGQIVSVNLVYFYLDLKTNLQTFGYFFITMKFFYKNKSVGYIVVFFYFKSPALLVTSNQDYCSETKMKHRE